MVISEIKKRYINKEKGYGLFSERFIQQGELVMRDEGQIATREQYFSLPPKVREWAYQVDEELVLMPVDPKNITDEWYVNHSCDPNTILRTDGEWYARRDIYPDEEITADYGLFWTNPFLEAFEINPCRCGATTCRGMMSGNDWMKKEFQEKYKAELPLYIQKKIAAMNGA